MKELFYQIVMRLALCGLAASFAVLAFRSWPVRAALARLSAIWRGLTAFGRFAVCAFLFVGVLEADKTNNVNNLPPQQMMAGGWVSQTGFTGLTGLGGVGNLVNPVNPVQTTPPRQTFASRWAANWNVCGAWKDSFWLDFGDGWVLKSLKGKV